MDGGSSLALNLGTGVGSSVRTIISAVERVSQRTFQVRNVARRAGDPAILVADAPGNNWGGISIILIRK
jgi:UDP-glucose 4-epimerase